MENKIKIYITDKLYGFCKTFLRVGFFLTIRRIRRNSVWLSILVTFIMFVTFINLVLVNGILVGLIEGSKKDNKEQYTSDVFINSLENETYIKNSNNIIKNLSSYDEIISYTPRVVTSGLIEANYKNRTNLTDKANELVTTIAGIEPELEDKTTNLSKHVIEGEYLQNGENNEILIGSNLLDRYSRGVSGDTLLINVYPGDTLRILINEKYHEVIVKGIVKSKVSSVGNRIFMNKKLLRKIIGTPNLNYQEIAIKLKTESDSNQIKKLIAKDFKKDADTKTSDEALGSFFQDIKITFQLLSNLIGGIALFVACITIYIIIFINAITRRKYIGILKGIGICDLTITISYILQALIYAIIGSIAGLLLTYFIIKPYIDQNPIDFPFSDGILSVPISMTLLRFLILIILTAIAGYIPSKIIVKKNTLDSILGRN